MEEKITVRIAELEKERDAYVAQANAMIQGYAATIAELKRLIAPDESAE